MGRKSQKEEHWLTEEDCCCTVIFIWEYVETCDYETQINPQTNSTFIKQTVNLLWPGRLHYFGVPVIAHATFDGAQLDLRKVPVTLCIASFLGDSMLLSFLRKKLSHCCYKGKLIPLKDIFQFGNGHVTSDNPNINFSAENVLILVQTQVLTKC